MQIKAIKLQPNEPFNWASGWKSPIYCDNRTTLSFPQIRNYLRENFEKTGTSKVQDEDISISIQNNPAKVNIIDESLIPQKFISTKTVESTDKKAIKQSLQNNEEVPGCELVQEKRISIK